MASTDFVDFRGKVGFITGAATGIGRAVAVGFASRGAKVAIGDINEEAARVHETPLEGTSSRPSSASQVRSFSLISS